MRVRSLTLPLILALAVAPSLAALRGRNLGDESSPWAPNPNGPSGGGGGGGGVDSTETVPEKPPLQDRATVQSVVTNQCIGDGDTNNRLDVRTDCNNGKQMQFAYTEDFHLRDANTGMCLDNMNSFSFFRGKAYPKLRKCGPGTRQQFFFVRMPGAEQKYKIMTRVWNFWIFAGNSRNNDLVFEYFRDCIDCQSFNNLEGAFDRTFFANAWRDYNGP